ncbi:metal-sensitive transcriptional regulator [Nostocoides vanveenii]|jgi:DNA-binding FrmR family transcriptional regulator|uniref:Metal-sensitive transcriptional regulator n=1 Tax=Nostocoides vanveenii TaxID=330835 RepID=A0ABP4W0B6_9MICO
MNSETDVLATHDDSTRPGYADTKDALSKRLRRIEGQVRGVERMIEEDRYCIDVLTQITAIQSGLKAVALGLLDEHLAHCVVHAAREGGQEEATKLAEVSSAIARLIR